MKPGDLVVVYDETYVRDVPAVNTMSMRQLRKNTMCLLVGKVKAEEYVWWLALFSDMCGWVWEGYIRPLSALDEDDDEG